VRRPHPGLIAAAALAGLVALALAGLASAGGAAALSLPPYLVGVTLGAARQAALSTALSLLIGTALALALARRRRFPGRALIVSLAAAATVAPTIVIIFGLVSVYGRAGPANAALAALGLPALPALYGLHGVVLAHVLMNAPLVARVMLNAFAALPAEHVRLAHMLRFGARDCFRHLDWPVIRREWPGLAAFVFLLCFTSFAVVLSLGGGPRNATLEVAIYEALRLEADFARAAAIAALQIGLCLAFVAGFSLLGARLPDVAGLRRPQARPDGAHPGLRLIDGAALALTLLLIAPVLASLAGGAAHLRALAEPDMLQAALTSALIAVAAAGAAVGLALLLASAAHEAPLGRPKPGRGRLIDLIVLALIGLPPFALVAGLFIWLKPFGSLQGVGLVLVPLVNALMALPFVYRLLAPPLRQSAARHGRLAASLGLTGAARLRIVSWPLLRRPLAAAFALSAALSLGDFGVIALFGGGELVTLPYLMAERMGAYRMDEAGAVALLLVATAGGLAWLADKA
jgi:thiamine transport system permease protein